MQSFGDCRISFVQSPINKSCQCYLYLCRKVKVLPGASNFGRARATSGNHDNLFLSWFILLETCFFLLATVFEKKFFIRIRVAFICVYFECTFQFSLRASHSGLARFIVCECKTSHSRTKVRTLHPLCAEAYSIGIVVVSSLEKKQKINVVLAPEVFLLRLMSSVETKR